MIGKHDVYGYRYTGTRYDCGSVSGYVAANVAYALERKELRKQVVKEIKTLLKE